MTKILALLLVAGLAACSSTKKTSRHTNNANSNGIACGDIPVEGPHLNWKIENDSVLKDYKGKRPANYKLYSISPEELDSFVNASKSVATLRSIIPLPAECEVYNLSFFETMNPKLKEKYPNLVTLRGSDLNSGQSDVSMSFNKGVIHGQINRNGTIYMISTIRMGNKPYYMIAQAPNDIRQNGNSSKTQKPVYDK